MTTKPKVIYYNTFWLRAAKTGARLHSCTEPPRISLSTYAISTKISCAGVTASHLDLHSSLVQDRTEQSISLLNHQTQTTHRQCKEYIVKTEHIHEIHEYIYKGHAMGEN